MTPKVLVIGKTGQLARSLKAQSHAADFEMVFSNRTELNLLSSEKALLNTLTGCEGIKGILLAAAYTDVEGAETEPETAHQINGRATQVIAEFCCQKQIPLLYISTDYVFDGQSQSAYRPDAATSPINIYGHSKKAGEDAVLSSGAKAVILRTSWLYDGIGKNFLTTMLRLAKAKTSVSVVADQRGKPTYAAHLAKACFKVMTDLLDNKTSLEPIYHVTDAGDPISWADFAEEIFEAARSHLSNVPELCRISTNAYPTQAKRPANSVLNIKDFEDTFLHTFPYWKEGVRKAVSEYFENSEDAA